MSLLLNPVPKLVLTISLVHYKLTLSKSITLFYDILDQKEGLKTQILKNYQYRQKDT